MSGKTKDLESGRDVLVILFETLAYITVCFAAEEKDEKFPIVESFTKSELEMDHMMSLVEVVCSSNHLYRIV